MDLVSKSMIHNSSQALSPMRSPSNSIFGGSRSHSDTSFPVIAIAIVGILATGFLLVSYYIFAIKCCLNWHRIDLLRRFSLSRNRRHEDPFMANSPTVETRGLDEAVIRSIPIFKYKKKVTNSFRDFGERSFCECAVCLNEFQEDEKLRRIPNCSHVFHIDCIDVWLQSNANCPLCRTSISSTPKRFPIDNRIIAPSSTPQDPNPYTESVINSDEDFVVIELGNHQSADQTLLATQERLNSGELLGRPISPWPPRKMQQISVHKEARKLHKVTSMGDECIDIRGKDEQFAIQPIRRSFSMDSSADLKLYLAIQEAVQQKRQVIEASRIEGCSSRSKRPFFTFGPGSRGSRSAVLPVYLEP